MKLISKKLLIAIITFAFFSYFFIDKKLALYFEQTSQITHDIFKFLTTFGYSEYFLVPSGLVFLYFYFRKIDSPIKEAAKYIFLSVATSGIIVIIIKIITARYRPVMFLEHNLYGFNFFEIGYKVNSFPSGHAATIMGGFSALAFLFPKYKWPLLLFGMVASFSRVVLEKHYLSDVLIGALIGYLVSAWLYKKSLGQRAKSKEPHQKSS